MTRDQLRKHSRQARRQLSQQAQHIAALQLATQFSRSLAYQKAKTLGLYLSFDGEISTAPLIEQAWQDGKQVYLPVVPRQGRKMRFVRFAEHTVLIKNKFGIWEPKYSQHIKSWAIDIVCMPLVAFDPAGNRMGMGGGFYDTTFAVKHQHGFGPKLVGFAHEVQKQATLPVAAWDVPLDAILTGTHQYGRL
ncbi:5-formyltetrahydrofolate cyclo-ligase [Salinibius halmophilus]|uniref:5-formyltetrahydrofolate cyclo-ligase n=1 Tax=Salinibius halmophilus TaxID=1853216 RepID=UPI000E66ABB9|nr:5-formyltetrahydrofolate cyclo-ligase [Salinibius halmophilus]